MTNDSQAGTAAITGLRALSWIAQEPDRLERFLALTGIGPDRLRAEAGSRALLGAVMTHIANHEPDLIACAKALGLTPEALAAAHAELVRD